MNSHHRPALALAIALAGSLTLAACGSDGSADADITPSAAPTAASASATPAPGSSAGSGTGSSAGGGVTRPSQPTRATASGSSATTTSYAQLTDVWKTGTSSYALSYDKVDYLTGAAAKAYYQKHPDLEPLSFAVSNTNPALRQLPVNPKATFFGSQQLGGGNGAVLKKITASQLVSAASAHPRTLVKVSQVKVGNHQEVTKVVEIYLP